MKWFKKKCYFCEQTKGFFHSVHDHGIYGEMGKRVYYHPECLEMIEMEPEKFGHIMMDKALKIAELKEECVRRHNSHIVEDYKKRTEKLQRQNFERMMPRGLKKPTFPPKRKIP